MILCAAHHTNWFSQILLPHFHPQKYACYIASSFRFFVWFLAHNGTSASNRASVCFGFEMHNPSDIALNFCYIEQRRKVLEKLVCKMRNTELPCLLCVQLLQHSEVPESEFIIFFFPCHWAPEQRQLCSPSHFNTLLYHQQVLTIKSLLLFLESNGDISRLQEALPLLGGVEFWRKGRRIEWNSMKNRRIALYSSFKSYPVDFPNNVCNEWLANVNRS